MTRNDSVGKRYQISHQQALTLCLLRIETKHRSAYTSAKRTADLFPPELKVVWEPLQEDEAPGVDEVVELAVRLESRLRAGEKVSTLLLVFSWRIASSSSTSSWCFLQTTVGS